jgi:hypothetical protein
MVGKAAIAVIGLTTLAAFSSGEEPVDDRPICVVAAEWVEDNPEALPTTLEGFADFSIPYRRAIANAMEPELRSSLWIEQLTEFRDASELSVEQVEFVNSLVGIVSEGLFTRGGRLSSRVPVRSSGLRLLRRAVHADSVGRVGHASYSGAGWSPTPPLVLYCNRMKAR